MHCATRRYAWRLLHPTGFLHPRRIAAILIIVLTAGIAWARSSGPPPSHTGAHAVSQIPAEPSCVACHLGNPINDASGWIHLDGLPATYRSGQPCTLSVVLAYPPPVGPRAWGFQLTAVDSATGLAAGSFDLPPTLQIRHGTPDSPYAGRVYVEHRSTSLFPGDTGPVTWTFLWTAPQTPVPCIHFFFAGNAADGTQSQYGDHIFTGSATLRLQTPPTSVQSLATGVVRIAVSPNPFSSRLQLHYTLAIPTRITLTIYDVAGRILTTPLTAMHQAGTHTFNWSSPHLPPGLYYVGLKPEATAPIFAKCTLIR